MSTTSPFIKMTLQALDENEDTWGSVLNVSALEMLEDAIAGVATASVTSGDVALNEDAGADNDPHYRMAIINITGAPGIARSVTCPPLSKIYLVINNTTGGFVITFKTTAGAGVTIPAATATWVYCDTTDILYTEVDNSATATLAATATNALSLGGSAAALYAKLATQQTWTKGQVIQRVVLTDSGSDITPDVSLSNSFYALWDGNHNLAAPIGTPVNGQTFSLAAQQDSAGGPFTISFTASTYIFEGGSAVTLSTGANALDLLGFEYLTDRVGGARWMVSILKGMA